jgi:hypothetical protein
VFPLTTISEAESARRQGATKTVQMNKIRKGKQDMKKGVLSSEQWSF